jgi:hypothetical protein
MITLTQFNDSKRAIEIKHLFRVLLEREPDEGGWKHYYDTELTIEEISNAIQSSPEYIKKEEEKILEVTIELTQIDNNIWLSTRLLPGHEFLLKRYGIENIIDFSTPPTQMSAADFSSVVHFPLNKLEKPNKNELIHILRYISFLIREDRSIVLSSNKNLVVAPVIAGIVISHINNMEFPYIFEKLRKENGLYQTRQTFMTAEGINSVLEDLSA